MPWLVFFLSSLYYYTTILLDDYNVDIQDFDRGYEIALSVLIIISLLYNVFIELIQLEGVNTFDYISNVWNLVDAYTFGSALWIMTV